MPRLNHNLSHSNANNNQQQTNLLTKIEENTKNINVNVGDVEINVQDVEALLATTNTTLASILIDTDAADSSLNTIEAQSVLTASRLNNIQNKISANVDGTGDTLGQINSNILLKNTEIETSLNSILVDSTAIKTSVQLLDNAISGNEMQVDVLTMPTVAVTLSGGATESKQDIQEVTLDAILAKNTEMESHLETISEFNIDNTDVSVTSIIPGVAATSLGKAIQSAQGATDTGIATLAVRNDTLADLAGADHDYAPLQVDASGALYTRSMVTELAITGTNQILTTIDADTNDIKTSLQLIDNAVDGNYLNVNQNIAGTDVDSNSGNKSAATQRVVIATDDVNLSAIKTSVELIDNAIYTGVVPSTKMNVNISSGTVTANLSAVDNAVLDSIVSKNTQIETLLTAANVDHAANEALLITIDADTNDIKTSTAACATDLAALEVLQTAANVDLAAMEVLLTAANVDHAANEALLTTIDAGIDTLEACVGSNKVNVNISSGSVSLPSGASSEAKQDVMETSLNAIVSKNTEIETLLTAANVDHAANEALLITIDSDTDAIKTSTAACATDLAALEVLSTAANVDLAAMEVLLTAANVDHAANEALLITIDADTNDIKTSTAACATDLAALEVLQTATNSKIDTLDSVVDNILVKNTLATTAEIKELLSNVTVNQATLSSELDTEHYEKIRLFGETSSAVGSDIKIFGSNTSGGTYYYLNNGDLQATTLTVSGLGSAHYIGGSFENIPRYIKVFNNSGSSNHTFTKLYMVGSGGRNA